MPGPDFAISSVVARNLAELRVGTSVPGDGVDGTDWRDVLSPSSWVLAGGDPPPLNPVPLVLRVEPYLDDPTQDPPAMPSDFVVILDQPLDPGGAYAIALAATARSASGAPTSTTAVAFVAPTYRSPTSLPMPDVAGDIAMSPSADSRGDVAVTDRATAYRNAVLAIVAARPGAFAHLPDAGLAIEAKRTYTPAQLASFATRMAAQIRRHPDTLDARVVVSELASASGALFEVTAIPRFAAPPIIETFRIGGA